MTDREDTVRRENDALKARVLELEARLERAVSVWGGDSKPASDQRMAVFREAERIARVGTWVWDLSSQSVGWSEELYRILGYDPRTVTPSPEAYYAAVHPDDRDELRDRAARWARGEIAPSTFRVVLRDGSVRHVIANGSQILDENGALLKLIGTCLDITDLTRANQELERAYRWLTEAQRIARVGSWVLDIPSGKLEWSAEFRHLLGVGEDEESSGELFLSRIHPEDRDRLARIHERALTEGAGRSEARVVHPDGRILHVHVVGTPVLDAAGKLVGLSGTMLDVTERVELEEQLLRARKLEALGTLAGGVAHDFNNLLTVIFGNLDLLRPHVSERGLSHVRGIEQAAELAGQLTKELLAFGRKAPLEQQVVDLNVLLPDALGIVRRLIGESAEIITTLEPGLWPVRVDKGQLHQIVLNLCVNARDAMPDGGEIHLRTRNVTVLPDASRTLLVTAGEYVVMEIQDHGMGLDEATRARIFEPFFSTKHSTRGAGLGLAVVFGAVAQHGGAIEVDSRPGEGATFRIYFPRAPSRANAEPVAMRATSTLRAHHAIKVLIVEDEPAVATMMAATLRGVGYEVAVAHRASEAFALWEATTQPFDLVISDVVMPEMRGPDLVRKLGEGGRLKRALFVTGYGPELFGDASESRGHSVLLKPFNAAQLLGKVDDVLRT